MHHIIVIMSIRIKYPKIIKLTSGKIITLDDDVWEKRLLMLETKHSEQDVRKILINEGYYEEELLEFKKESQLGNGFIKKIDPWQIHIRLFQHNKNIQLDAEAELSNSYLEHLDHGWVSAFNEIVNITKKHFGEIVIYHKGAGEYVSEIIQETVLTLKDANSKTNYKHVAVSFAFGVMVGAVILWIIKNLKDNDD